MPGKEQSCPDWLTAEAHRNHQIQDSVALGEKSRWLTVPHHTQLPKLCKLRAQKNKQETTEKH